MEKKQGDVERERQYCELCGKMENLLKCGRCRNSFYCSKEHQKQDWKKHKLSCKEPQPPKQKPGQTPPAGEDAKMTPEKAEGALPSTTKAAGVGDRQVGNDDDDDGANETSTPNGQSSPSPQKLAAEYIVPCMNKHGICVVDNFLGAEVGQSILENVKALHHTGRFSDGQLVSQKGDSTKDIRGDKITWIEGKEAGCEKIRVLMGRMDDLIRHCNGKLGNYSINGRTKVSIRCRSCAVPNSQPGPGSVPFAGPLIDLPSSSPPGAVARLIGRSLTRTLAPGLAGLWQSRRCCWTTW